MLQRSVFALAALFTSISFAHAQLPQAVAQALQQNGIGQDEIGVLVLRGDATVLEHRAGLPMQPASTMKLVTTLVGRERLGPPSAAAPGCAPPARSRTACCAGACT